MAVIRAGQSKAFDDSAMDRFRAGAAAHAREAYPKHMRYLSDEALAERVDESIEKSKSYGIEKEGGMLLIQDMTFLLGVGFDTDPQLPWTAEILSDTELTEAVKLDRLHKELVEYLERVSGPENTHIDAAQVRMRSVVLDDLPSKPGPELEMSVARKMHDVFPEKFAYLGRDRIRALITAAATGAGSHGISSNRGVAVYLGLMYMLGSSFDQDSLYSWASDILRDGELAEAEKVSRLHTGSMEFLAEWCG